MFVQVVAAALQWSTAPQLSLEADAWLRRMADCAPIETCVDLISEVDGFGQADRSVMRGYGVDIVRASLYRYGELGLDQAFEVARADGFAGNLMIDVLKAWPELEFSRVRQEGFEFVPTAVLKVDPATIPDELLEHSAWSRRLAFRAMGVSASEAWLTALEHASFLGTDRRIWIDKAWSDFTPDAIILVDQWTRLLIDPSQPIERRSRALNGVTHFSHVLFPYFHRLEDMDPEWMTDEQRERLVRARTEAGDSSLAASIALDCLDRAEAISIVLLRQESEPSVSGRWDLLDAEFELQSCLNDVAAAGRLAKHAAQNVAVLLRSDHLPVRIMALQTLEALGDRRDLDAVRAALASPHWMEAAAAVQALGRLGEPQDLMLLEQIAASHWHWLVRETAGEARRVFSAFHREFPPGENPLPVDALTAANSDEVIAGRVNPGVWPLFEPLPEQRCRSEQFSWDGDVYSPESRPHYARAPDAEWDAPSRLAVEGGAFAFSDRGEWGGELYWEPEDGERLLLISDNIHDVIRVEPGGFIATTGLAHLSLSDGAFYRVARAGEDWVVTLIDQVISPPSWAAPLPGGLVGARADEGFYVMDDERVIGMGDCVPGPPWPDRRL